MNSKSIAAAALVLITAFGCNKPDDAPQNTAGKGGNALMKINTFHHERRIDSCMVYIKYNAQDAPGNGIYDDSARVTSSPTDTVATFSGLKVGKYYLYGNGWDPLYGSVHGGLPYTVNNDNAQMTFTLPVSEE